MRRFTPAPSTLALFTCLAISSACSSSEDTPDAGGTNKDAAAGDAAGGDSGAPDSGTPDAGPCNPVDGSGCNAGAGEYCVWVTNTDQAQCRTLGAANPFESQCSTALLDCAAGNTCIQLQNEPNATCHKTCLNTPDCTGLQGQAPSYACARIQGLSYGVCVGQQMMGMNCDPVNDTCPMNEVCTLTGQAVTTCEMAGTSSVGEACGQTGNCARGGICLQLQGDPSAQCYEPCNPMGGMCGQQGAVCGGLQGVSWGICQVPASSCDPLNDTCPMNQVCGLNGLDVECVAEGMVPVGGDCSQMGCAQGGICVFLMGQQNPICYEPCNLQTPMCTMGQCGNIGLSFGICI